jgi:hypothetical protein
VEFDSVEDASPKGVGKIGSRATSLPRWPDRPAHLSTQIPVPSQIFVERAAQASESPVFATFLESTLVTIDSE